VSLFAWSAARVREALGLPAAQWDHAYGGISTDTRSLREGEVFVALAGERFDAHDYVGDARLAGVAAAVVRHGTPPWPGIDWFEVDDTRAALGALARYRRQSFEGPVVAVTGTNGKTSTKELIAAALGARYSVHKSEQNFNNTVGVPRTLLAMPLEATAAVVECGASLRGEIARLRDIVMPTIAVITNVGAGHLEGLGGIEGVMEEKLALAAGAPLAVVGMEPPELATRATSLARRVVSAGLGRSEWAPESLALLSDGRPRFTVRGRGCTLALRGRHMAANAMIALAVADAAGVDLADALSAIEGVTIPGARSEVSESVGVTVINDCYNANPQSLVAALELLQAIRAGRRAVVVVGSMRELGPDAPRLHEAAAREVLAARPDLIVAVGDFQTAFAATGPGGARLIAGPTPESVGLELKEELRAGDVMLLKASRGVELERLLPILWPGG
jgi:UDP-N-acetylmuramoyl-tripeptide--D-alanyl-D-alanine ligase